MPIIRLRSYFMKKNSIIIGLFFTFCFIFSSCKLDVKAEKTLHRPDTELQAGNVVITGSYDSNAIEYINVFRVDSENPGAKPINIGVIFPSGFNENNKTYTFYDQTGIVGKKYSYFCRVFEGKYGYYTTEKSDPIEITTGFGLPSATYSNDDDLKCNVGSEYLTYNEDTKIIKLSTSTDFRPAYAKAPSAPEYTDYCLVVTNGTTTESFLLSEKGDWSDKTPAEWNLQITLPESFFNKDIKVLGLISQRKEIEDTKIKRLYWTNIADIKVKNEADSTEYTNNTFQIVIQSGSNGTDYGYLD